MLLFLMLMLLPMLLMLLLILLLLIPKVLLKGLQLVPEALSEGLDIPVDVKWGHVGLFQLSVPWSKLGSKPVCVCVLCVLCVLVAHGHGSACRFRSADVTYPVTLHL